MKINWMNEVVAVGVGGADEGMGYWDEKSGRVGAFKTALDWGRIGMVVLGAVGTMWNFYPKIAEPMLNSATTLLTKSAVSAIRSGMGTASHAATRTRVGRRMVIRQTPGEGFEDVKPLL
jgi:hypothetical protein